MRVLARWFVCAVLFLMGNLIAFSGNEPLKGHIAVVSAAVLLSALAIYAAVLIVMRIRASRASGPLEEEP